jgi:hypothetical protein
MSMIRKHTCVIKAEIGNPRIAAYYRFGSIDNGPNFRLARDPLTDLLATKINFFYELLDMRFAANLLFAFVGLCLMQSH